MNANKVRFQNVCNFIDENLSEPLTLDKLCDVAQLSKFHFHRLFHLNVGLPVLKYVQLQRMKRAANQIYYHHHLSITHIAFEAGFENAESFSRAFKKTFAVTPTQFKLSPNWLPISQTNTKVNSLMQPLLITDVKIQWFDKVQIASLTHKGSPQTLHITIKKFIDWRKEHHTPPGKSKTFNILYNDPQITPAEEYRFDIATNIDSDNLTPDYKIKPNSQDVVLQELPEGYCAVLRHIGSDDRLGELINFLYSEWLRQSEKSLRNFPCFIERVKMYPSVNQNEAITDIYLPIE